MNQDKCFKCGSSISDRSKATETNDGLLCDVCAGRSQGGSSPSRSSKKR